MRMFLLAATALALAAPASAETLDEVVKHGIILVIQGMEINVAYTPDGKFTAAEGQVTGTWKIDGDKLCTTTDQGENCTTYPADKKSGDTFEVSNEQGSAKVHIK